MIIVEDRYNAQTDCAPDATNDDPEPVRFDANDIMSPRPEGPPLRSDTALVNAMTDDDFQLYLKNTVRR